MKLHALETLAPIDATKPTKKQRAEAVASLMFLKENINGNIKVRKCSDVRKQKETIKKEDAASPSCHRVSINNLSSGRTWRLGHVHIWHSGGISSYINRWICNHVYGSITSWDHDEGSTQDIAKVCHHDQQGETAPISPNIKGILWPTVQRNTVI